MLTSLAIRDVVLIDRLDLDFRAGLSVGLAEAERQHPGFLDGLRRTEGERPLASIARRAALLRREG